MYTNDIKVHVFHHNDHDGIFAGRIAYEYYEYKYHLSRASMKFYSIDYTMKLEDLLPLDSVEPGSIILFLDYSFSNEDNIEYLHELSNKCKETVHWIDHHISSIEREYEYTWMKDIRGIRNTSRCGAVLTWLYFIKNIRMYSKDNIPIYKTTEELNTAVYDFKESKIPIILRYIDSFDRWVNYMPNTNEFHFGLTDVFSVESPFFIRKWSWHDTTPLHARDNQKVVDKIIKSGKDILKYLDNENENFIKTKAFPFTIIHGTNTYRCCGLNREGTSLMFKSVEKEYDILCTCRYNGDEWAYSLFRSSRNKEVNVSDIAKAFGGGGHPGAAGFVNKDLIIRRDSIIVTNDNGYINIDDV